MRDNQMQDNPTRQETIEMVRKYIHGIRFAMLTTIEVDGSLRTRPMTTQEVEFDGDLWFFASKHSVQALQANSQASAAYSDPDKSIYVSMAGRAEIVTDKQKIKDLWNPLNAAYFKGGVDDPEIALICVHVDTCEYWDAPSSKTVRMFNMIKSVITGQRDDQGHHERVEL
jgi:general stress protein 26